MDAIFGIIGFFTVILLIIWGLCFALHSSANEVRNEAVKEGVGRWTCDTNGFTKFEWITNKAEAAK